MEGNNAKMREAQGDSRPCNAHCDDYECPKNAGGLCHAPNPCLGYEEAGRVMAELEAAKRELAKSRAGGDAAKMREALEAVFDALHYGDIGAMGDCPTRCALEEVKKLIKMVESALAAPQPVTDCNQLNAARMREALEQICVYLEPVRKWQVPKGESQLTALFAVADTVYRKAKDALASPPRNADVGSPEEQMARFLRYCNGRDCPDCPLLQWKDRGERYACALAWAQMPYEAKEGGAK